MKVPLKGYLCFLALMLAVVAIFVWARGNGRPATEVRKPGSSTIESTTVAAQPPLKLFLPTDNREIFGDPSKFYMYTNRTFEGVSSKPWQGGQYGFVRNQRRTSLGILYTRLHEGIDIRPVRRDSKGEPLDDVRSISAGIVVYVNASATASNYGKYIVVQHNWPEGSFFSLYAHMMTTDVRAGQPVEAGARLGRMGYTGSGLDRERAHVHVELNFMLSERFKTWYGKHFTSKNHHGSHNGINMTGMDLARFILDHRNNPNITMRQFLDGEEPYFKVLAPGSKVPGILRRHPFLGRNMEAANAAQSWEFTFARTGVPLSISPSTSKLKYPAVTWVKPMNSNHSYLTMGRLVGSGDKASLSARGSRYIQLISEAF